MEGHQFRGRVPVAADAERVLSPGGRRYRNRQEIMLEGTSRDLAGSQNGNLDDSFDGSGDAIEKIMARRRARKERYAAQDVF